jgi:hypothetical protein
MQDERDTALSGPRQLGRVGALGVVATGVLCAAVLSVVSRVPPDPVDRGEIPGIKMGSKADGGANPASSRDVTPAHRTEPATRTAARRSGGLGRRSSRGRGSGAPAVARGESGGPRPAGIARPVSGNRAPHRLGGDRGAPAPAGPGGGNDDGGDARAQPNPGPQAGRDDGDGPPPAPAPAAASPPDDEAAPAPSATAQGPADEDADDAAPPVATPAPAAEEAD